MSDVLCPDCGHDINEHHQDDQQMIDACWSLENSIEEEGGTRQCTCNCNLKPSDIARALLTAEPSGAEIRACARGLALCGGCRSNGDDIEAAKIGLLEAAKVRGSK